MPPGWPSPASAFGLLFCKMRSMCWDVCNLLHAVFPPWGHTPSQAATHCDTCWQAALRARSAPGDGPVTHTRPPLRSHPHPGRSHCSRRAPPAGPRRRFCAPSPSPRRETAAGRAAMSSRRRPPARPPGPNSLQMPGGPAAPVRAGRRLSGAPCRAPRAGSRSWRPRRDWGRGLPTPEGEGLVPLGPARGLIPVGVSWRRRSRRTPRGSQAPARDPSLVGSTPCAVGQSPPYRLPLPQISRSLPLPPPPRVSRDDQVLELKPPALGALARPCPHLFLSEQTP